MFASGDFLVPHLNGDLYTQKPPLLFWSIALASAPLGRVTETTARIPSALAALVALLAVYRIGERLVSRRAAWIAALSYATCGRIVWQGRFGQIDMLLCALVALGVWFWVRAFSEERPALALGFFACAGVATIAKGPVGLLPPLFGILAFLLATRRKGAIRDLRLGRGLALYAGIVLAWLVPAALAAPAGYLESIAFKQTVTRYADPWHHVQPAWYYLKTIPADFFPWTFLLPTALVVGWRRLLGRARDGYLFGLSWVVATVVFFSLSAGKREVYVLTMFPGLALIVGAALDRLAADWDAAPRRGRSALTLPLAALALLAIALPLAAWFGGRGRPEAAPVGGEAFVAELAIVLAALALGSMAAFGFARAGRVTAAVASLAAGMGTVAIAAALVLLPRFDAVKSARGLSRVLVERAAPGEPYAIYPRLDSTFLFYTERFAEVPADEAALQAFARRPGRVWVLAQRDDLAKLATPLPLAEIARDPDAKQGYVLLGPPDPARP